MVWVILIIVIIVLIIKSNSRSGIKTAPVDPELAQVKYGEITVSNPTYGNTTIKKDLGSPVSDIRSASGPQTYSFMWDSSIVNEHVLRKSNSKLLVSTLRLYDANRRPLDMKKFGWRFDSKPDEDFAFLVIWRR